MDSCPYLSATRVSVSYPGRVACLRGTGAGQGLQRLPSVIGPPLRNQLTTLGQDERQVVRAVALLHERPCERVLFENEGCVCPGEVIQRPS